MECPFCGIRMENYRNHVGDPANWLYQHPNEGGRLLTVESGPCPYVGRSLRGREIDQIIVALIDIDH